jgi:Methyltransferase domain
MTDNETLLCPVCGGGSDALEPAPGWGEWRACRECTLEFVSPFELREQPTELYGGAYRGNREESRMREFNDRVEIRRALIEKDPTLWFWTPAFERTLDWLDRRVGAGATVFEIGCGLGWVLHAMRRRGLDPVGLDVAELPVELNRKDGFEVWHGTLDTVPEDWVKPAAVVAFFMLHHVPDPLAFVREIRDRFPDAPLSLAQYGPSNRDHLASMPPRTLTRWNAKSLETVMRIAGYDAEVTEIQGTGNEATALRPLRKLLKQTIAVPALYRAIRRVEQRVMPRLLAPTGRDAYVVHGLGEPRAR